MTTLAIEQDFCALRVPQRAPAAQPEPGFPAALEPHYQHDLTVAKYRSFCQASMLCILLYVGFGVLDLWALPDAVSFAWPLRAVVILATVACLLRTWRDREWFMRHYSLITLGLYGLWGVGLEAIIAAATPGDAAWTQYYVGLILVMMAMYTWTYVTPCAAAIFGAVLTLCYFGIAVGMQGIHLRPEAGALVTSAFFLISTNMIGLLSMRAREKFSRQAFLLKHMLCKDLEKVGIEQRKTRHRSEHDYLTGLPNRMQFERRAQELMASASVTGSSVGLLFVDLDGFKPINDLHGHAAGDAVLADVASKIMGSVRGEDLAARLGGDEFVIAIPLAPNNTDRLHSLRLGLSMRIGQALKWEGQNLRVTASIGVACFPADGDTLAEVLAHADRNMYLDKRRAALRA